MTTAKTPQDAISLSLAEYGEIKPSFMKDVLGENWAEQCDDILFKTPFTEDEYETVDAYLSGDVKTKLEQARAAAKEDATLQRNVDALEAVQPKDIPFEDISIRMGARWIPAEVYTDFMYEQFGIPKYTYKDNKSGVEYLPEVDQYVVNVDKNELEVKQMHGEPVEEVHQRCLPQLYKIRAYQYSTPLKKVVRKQKSSIRRRPNY